MERAILARLTRGDLERFELSDVAIRALGRILVAVLRGPDATAEVRRVLQLATALEKELESPAAAARLRTLLAGEPDARTLIRRDILRLGTIDETRDFLRREGREVFVTAPDLDALEQERTRALEALPPRSHTSRYRRAMWLE